MNVFALAGYPPEVLAYAFAMYSRSAFSIAESIKKITTEKASGFLEKFYHGYGHASIADMAHVPLAIEDVSQLAAFALEDFSLWDGQERSTRYQQWTRGGDCFMIPPGLSRTPYESHYVTLAEFLLGEYEFFSQACFEWLVKANPKPEGIADSDYERTLRARAFDVARYWLFGGTKTSLGQITSARTLEWQIINLLSSEYPELATLGETMKQACIMRPLQPDGSNEPPVAPTLVRHTAKSNFIAGVRILMREFALGIFQRRDDERRYVDLGPPAPLVDEIVATMLYEVTQLPYREVLNRVQGLPPEQVKEIMNAVFTIRGDRDTTLPRAFSAGYPFLFDIVMDRGGQRDMHRHRRCIQIHQTLTTRRGFDIPQLIADIGQIERYAAGMERARMAVDQLFNLVGPDAHYGLPFAFRVGMLMKMDPAELIYIAELRSGVKGHFSYREVACQMYELLARREPGLYAAHLAHPKSDGSPRVTPLETEDLLKR